MIITNNVLMPTKKQLFAGWMADRVLGPYGHNNELYGDPPQSHKTKEFTGKEIGTISYDPKTDDLRVNLHKDEDKNDEKDIP